MERSRAFLLDGVSWRRRLTVSLRGVGEVIAELKLLFWAEKGKRRLTSWMRWDDRREGSMRGRRHAHLRDCSLHIQQGEILRSGSLFARLLSDATFLVSAKFDFSICAFFQLLFFHHGHESGEFVFRGGNHGLLIALPCEKRGFLSVWLPSGGI